MKTKASTTLPQKKFQGAALFLLRLDLPSTLIRLKNRAFENTPQNGGFENFSCERKTFEYEAFRKG